jgi:hypothetical protein
MILRLFEQARIVPDNPFALPPSMEVRLQISGAKTGRPYREGDSADYAGAIICPLVSATLGNHANVRVSEGRDIGEGFFCLLFFEEK